MMPTRLLLADDHQIVREGFRTLLEQSGFAVVAEASTGDEAVRLARNVPFDVALLDISMPRMNGMNCAREILSFAPAARIILLTVHTEEHQVAAALRAGIRGYVTKMQAADELTQAIRQVATGGTYLGPQVSSVLLAAYMSGTNVAEDPLTLRERQVLQLVAEGNRTKEIAEVLGLTAKTTESYRSRLMAKLDIHHTAGLVHYALRHGIVQLTAAYCCRFLPAIADAIVDIAAKL
jgi:two-component system, NarL family, response regulator NreC